MDLAADKVEIVFYLNVDDPKLPEYDFGLRLTGQDAPPVLGWNRAASVARGDILLHGGDDMIFETQDWDLKIAEAMPADGIGCVVTQDGRGPESWPHYSVGRRWVTTLGYFAPPWFFFWCGDLWTTEVAKAVGRLYPIDVMIRHSKVQDETAARVRRGVWHWRDQDLYRTMAPHRAFEAQRLRDAMQMLR